MIPKKNTDHLKTEVENDESLESYEDPAKDDAFKEKLLKKLKQQAERSK